MSEPSQIAKDAAKDFELDHFGNWPGDDVAAVKFQSAIDSALSEKDREIAELRSQMGNDFMAGIVIEHEKRIAKLEGKLAVEESIRTHLNQRISEARILIEKFGTVASDDSNVIRRAEEWLKGKP